MRPPRKPRDQLIYIGCEEKFDRVLESADSFIMPDDGRTYHVFHQREHPRDTKQPKTIYALFQFFGARDVRKSPMAELARYDQVFAMDTNHKDGRAGTAVARLSRGLDRFDVVHRRHFAPTTDKPEREGWVEFLQRKQPAPDRRRCLVVDSDLGALTRINRREEPILADFFLPEGWQLNFATADKADFVLNKMMRLCDREAAMVREKRR